MIQYIVPFLIGVVFQTFIAGIVWTKRKEAFYQGVVYVQGRLVDVSNQLGNAREGLLDPEDVAELAMAIMRTVVGIVEGEDESYVSPKLRDIVDNGVKPEDRPYVVAYIEEIVQEEVIRVNSKIDKHKRRSASLVAENLKRAFDEYSKLRSLGDS